MGIVVELRAAEGGADARALVDEQFAIFAKRAHRKGLSRRDSTAATK